MSFDCREENEYTIVTISDARLDAASSSTFQNFLVELIDSGSNQIIIDLSMVKFMDSSGLGSLIAGLKKLQGQGSISLLSVQPIVQKLFDLTSMDKLFTIHNSFAEAVNEKTK